MKNAGHQITSQYPDEISKILNTFLSTSGQSSWIIPLSGHEEPD